MKKRIRGWPIMDTAAMSHSLGSFSFLNDSSAKKISMKRSLIPRRFLCTLTEGQLEAIATPRPRLCREWHVCTVFCKTAGLSSYEHESFSYPTEKRGRKFGISSMCFQKGTKWLVSSVISHSWVWVWGFFYFSSFLRRTVVWLSISSSFVSETHRSSVIILRFPDECRQAKAWTTRNAYGEKSLHLTEKRKNKLRTLSRT